jgi:sec-independent protein translocase protein TatA
VFGLGITELIVILVVALLIFGPGRLPDVGKFLGKSLRDFRDALERRSDDEPTNQPAVKQDDEPEGDDAGKRD